MTFWYLFSTWCEIYEVRKLRFIRTDTFTIRMPFCKIASLSSKVLQTKKPQYILICNISTYIAIYAAFISGRRLAKCTAINTHANNREPLMKQSHAIFGWDWELTTTTNEMCKPVCSWQDRNNWINQNFTDCISNTFCSVYWLIFTTV